MSGQNRTESGKSGQKSACRVDSFAKSQFSISFTLLKPPFSVLRTQRRCLFSRPIEGFQAARLCGGFRPRSLPVRGDTRARPFRSGRPQIAPSEPKTGRPNTKIGQTRPRGGKFDRGLLYRGKKTPFPTLFSPLPKHKNDDSGSKGVGIVIFLFFTIARFPGGLEVRDRSFRT